MNKIPVYIDGAHNLSGAQQIHNYFRKKNLKTWLIIGMLNNKNLHGFLETLKPILQGIIAISIPKEKNSFKPKEILNISDKLKITSYEKSSINKANSFLQNMIKPKVILVSGSLYLVGKVRHLYL